MAKNPISVTVCLVFSIFARDVNCVLTACTSPTNDCTTEPNSRCVDSACVCLATFKEAASDCARVTCPASPLDHTPCTTDDTNSYCNAGNCACKKNFDGAGVVNCTRATCGNNAPCTEPNAYCSSTAPTGCTCGFVTTADATGACTAKTCTLATQVTTCGTNSLCHATTSTYQCACAVNYEPGPAGCTQKACSGALDCDTNSACTGSFCVCASGFTASGTLCKTTCSGAGTGVCLATNATCTNNVCECNVNWEGTGAACTQLSCSDASTCHPNSQCRSNLCECATGWVTDRTVCKKSCTASSGCATNALCISTKCECKINYVGDGGTTCAQKGCSVNSDCSGLNTACTASKCECASGYEASTTAVECILTSTPVAPTTTAGGNVVLYNSLLVLVSFVASRCVTKIF